MINREILDERFRKAKFGSTDECRAAIRANKLIVDYVYEVMMEQGVLTVTDDGQVIGQPVRSTLKTGGQMKYVSKEWGPFWPRRDVLVRLLKEGPKRFTELQEGCIQAETNHGHWGMIHALRFLEKAGSLVKNHKHYEWREKQVASAPVAESVDDELPPDLDDIIDMDDADNQIVFKACKKVGPPYDEVLVGNHMIVMYAVKGITMTPILPKLKAIISTMVGAKVLPAK